MGTLQAQAEGKGDELKSSKVELTRCLCACLCLFCCRCMQVVLDGNFFKNFGDLFDDACWDKK